MNLEFYADYTARLFNVLSKQDYSPIHQLALALKSAWQENRRVYLCGNGGSAANAMHMANDFMFGSVKGKGRGIRAVALSADSAIMTCIANDISYEQIYSSQLNTLGQPGDILIVLSGSGNSKNIVQALHKAKELQMKSFAILGYSGGICRELADTAIHFPVNDMQISEDLQIMVGHMVMQWLSQNLVTHHE